MILKKIITKKSLNYLRSKKYSFKIKLNLFKFNSVFKNNELPKGSIVYISDSNIWPGGLVDRLKGIISLYEYALENKRPFYIYFDKKNDFSLFLKPLNNNLYLHNFIVGLFTSKIHFYIDNTIINKYDNIFSTKRVNYIYTNLDLLKYKYKLKSNQRWRELFNKLFYPSHEIINKINKIIGNKVFSVYAFRFRSRMGDFEDDDKCWSESTKKNKVNLLNKAVMNLLKKDSSTYIYLASDSLEYIQQLVKFKPNIFFYYHLSEPDINDLERSLAEFLIISKSQNVAQFKTSDMFTGAFSKYASILGNINYNLIDV